MRVVAGSLVAYAREWRVRRDRLPHGIPTRACARGGSWPPDYPQLPAPPAADPHPGDCRAERRDHTLIFELGWPLVWRPPLDQFRARRPARWRAEHREFYQ
jgi:hypothetical protein